MPPVETPRFAPAPLVRAESLGFAWPDGPTVLAHADFVVEGGTMLVLGGDGRGKTTVLRLLAGELAPTSGRLLREPVPLFWRDPRDPADDALGVEAWLAREQARFATWDALQAASLLDGFALQPHLGKSLFQLSTGSRRKLWLVAALACGAPLRLLDTPFSALDAPARALLARELLRIADQRGVACVVADFACPPGLEGRVSTLIDLGD
jgi:ABC-type nitrate/sulfonate/bicarbonate transport system ATPase subunit